MAPCWADAGLYYPRNDQSEDADGNRTLIEPMSGNVLLGYARLNVPDGLWGLYNKPWDRARFQEPAITGVAQDIDVARAFFDDASNKLHFTIARLQEAFGDGTVRIGNAVRRGLWALMCEASEVAHGSGSSVQYSGAIHVQAEGDDLLLRLPKGFSSACAIAFSSTA